MKHRVIRSALIAAALLVSAALSPAVENKAATPEEGKASGGSKATAKSAKAKDAAPAAKVKLVDINSAGKKELMTLPGIGATDADRIIAGRPYLTKAHLVTHNVISRVTFENLKSQVVAMQKDVPLAKPGQK